MANVIVTCRTDGCANEGVGIEMPDGYEMDGEYLPMTGYVCGVCDQEITEIQPIITD